LQEISIAKRSKTIIKHPTCEVLAFMVSTALLEALVGRQE